MLRSCLITLQLIVSVLVFGQGTVPGPKLIPQPVSMQPGAGTYTLPNAVSIDLSDQVPGLITISEQLSERIK